MLRSVYLISQNHQLPISHISTPHNNLFLYYSCEIFPLFPEIRGFHSIMPRLFLSHFVQIKPPYTVEIAGVNRKHLQEIKQLENEVPKWQVLVDCVTGVSLPEFDSKTLAVLKGRIVRYLIQSREVTFGRSAKDNKVDIDLSLEGPAWKISRRQGFIKMDSNGDFYLINEGKKPMFIDGKPVLMGNKYKLNNNSVIEITVLRFIFIVNTEALAALRSKSSG
ncbi:microspherule protein 1 [Trichonephila clavata]|uniref:Microspherule protein 1 n=1 Tax=Trichonephila clavata TaxID=2740835 RepID=A0A8X6JGV3_TRICU|nr:microspherule protein 1 [Trichonephila clavata]